MISAAALFPRHLFSLSPSIPLNFAAQTSLLPPVARLHSLSLSAYMHACARTRERVATLRRITLGLHYARATSNKLVARRRISLEYPLSLSRLRSWCTGIYMRLYTRCTVYMHMRCARYLYSGSHGRPQARARGVVSKARSVGVGPRINTGRARVKSPRLCGVIEI